MVAGLELSHVVEMLPRHRSIFRLTGPRFEMKDYSYAPGDSSDSRPEWERKFDNFGDDELLAMFAPFSGLSFSEMAEKIGADGANRAIEAHNALFRRQWARGERRMKTHVGAGQDAFTMNPEWVDDTGVFTRPDEPGPKDLSDFASNAHREGARWDWLRRTGGGLLAGMMLGRPGNR